MEKDYNRIKLENGVKDAVEQALADITITGIKCKVEQYEAGVITAAEFNRYVYDITLAIQVGKQ